MQYKTMTLELLKQCPQLHEQLRHQRMLLPALDRFAIELKASHETWKEALSQTRPDSDPSQIASEALELALKELEARLSCASAPDGPEALSLDDTMAFLLRPTPPG